MKNKAFRYHATLTMGGLLIGILFAYSAKQWMNGIERGHSEVAKAKKDLIASAGFMELHNQVYSKVGPRRWEEDVKPRFMSALTYATIRDTETLFPEPRDVVTWVRAHPEEARRLLLEAASLTPE